MSNLDYRIWDPDSKRMMDLDDVAFPIEVLERMALEDEHYKVSPVEGPHIHPWILIQDLEAVGGVLMKGIGLKDKNGVKIYEGDILKGPAVVEYFDNLNWDSGGSVHPGFYCKEWFEYKDPGALGYHQGFDDCEVIGNIHENPELVK